MKYGLSNEEAIHAIKSNYPPENYTVLREALDMATNALQQLTEKDATIEKLQDMSQRWEKAFTNADKQYLKKEKEAAELRRMIEGRDERLGIALDEAKRLRKALEEARQYPRQPNGEGGWTIKDEFLAEVSEMTEDDGEYCSMEQVEIALLCAERLLGEGDKE